MLDKKRQFLSNLIEANASVSQSLKTLFNNFIEKEHPKYCNASMLLYIIYFKLLFFN